MFGAAAGGPERSGGPPSAHRHTYRPRFHGQVRLRTAQLRPSAGCPAYEPADRGEEEGTDRDRPDQHSHRHTYRQQEGRCWWRELSGLSGPTQTRTYSVKLERLYWINLTLCQITPGSRPSVRHPRYGSVRSVSVPTVHLSIRPRCGGSSVPLQIQLPAEAMARRRSDNVYFSRRD